MRPLPVLAPNVNSDAVNNGYYIDHSYKSPRRSRRVLSRRRRPRRKVGNVDDDDGTTVASTSTVLIGDVDEGHPRTMLYVCQLASPDPNACVSV